jgi:hypothetical protein
LFSHGEITILIGIPGRSGTPAVGSVDAQVAGYMGEQVAVCGIVHLQIAENDGFPAELADVPAEFERPEGAYPVIGRKIGGNVEKPFQ